MKLTFKKVFLTLGAFSLIGGSAVLLPLGNETLACGWGGSGGESYTPQQNNSGSYNQNSALTKEQAAEIVGNYVKRLNPELTVGNVNDVGPLYEAEILSASEEEVLQVIGVYKQSGKLVVIN